MKKNYSLLVKRGKIPLKRPSQSNIALGEPIFCSRHQRVNINENPIFSKCLVIKWETFLRKSFEKKLFPLGEKMKNTLKKALPKQYCFGRAHFLFQTPERVNINENPICSKCLVIKWETFIRKSFEKKLFPLGEKMENTLKKALPKQYCFGRAHFLFQTPEG